MGVRHVMLLLSMLGMASALKCYLQASCTGDSCDPKEGDATCTGDMCTKTYTKNGDTKSYQRGCMDTSSGVSAECKDKEADGVKGTVCYCDEADLCNAAMATTGSVVTTAAAILLAKTLLW